MMPRLFLVEKLVITKGWWRDLERTGRPHDSGGVLVLRTSLLVERPLDEFFDVAVSRFLRSGGGVS